MTINLNVIGWVYFSDDSKVRLKEYDILEFIPKCLFFILKE